MRSTRLKSIQCSTRCGAIRGSKSWCKKQLVPNRSNERESENVLRRARSDGTGQWVDLDEDGNIVKTPDLTATPEPAALGESVEAPYRLTSQTLPNSAANDFRGHFASS